MYGERWTAAYVRNEGAWQGKMQHVFGDVEGLAG